jgi:hypothetical protein
LGISTAIGVKGSIKRSTLTIEKGAVDERGTLKVLRKPILEQEGGRQSPI